VRRLLLVVAVAGALTSLLGAYWQAYAVAARGSVAAVLALLLVLVMGQQLNC
jgi:hypothetical protein